MGEKYFQESDRRIWVKNQEFCPGSGSIKLFLLGGCRPPDPLQFLGGFQPPRPPGGGPAAPRAPSLIFERLRLSSSPFFWVPKSWYQDLGTKILKVHLTGDEMFPQGTSSCLLYTSPSPRDQRGSRMPSSA